jgi:hypothetical protein
MQIHICQPQLSSLLATIDTIFYKPLNKSMVIIHNIPVWRTCLSGENLQRQERENPRGEYEENAPILPVQFSQSCQSSLTTVFRPNK